VARIRSVKPAFFHHEGLASCTPHARLLFVAMWQLADRSGRFRWIPMQVHAHAFPHEPELDVTSLAEELRAVGCISPYEAAGRIYVLVNNFTKHQKVPTSERKSANPEPREKSLTTFVRHGVEGQQTPCHQEVVLEVWKDGGMEERSDPGSDHAGDVAKVWSVYRGYHPRSRQEPTASWRKLIEKALREHSADDLCLVVRWAKESTSYAYQRKNGYDRLNNILVASKLPGRVESALEWSGASTSLEGWLEKNASAALRFKDECEQLGRPMLAGSLIHYMSEYKLPVPSPSVEVEVMRWLEGRNGVHQ